jgi:phage terminase small subunit
MRKLAALAAALAFFVISPAAVMAQHSHGGSKSDSMMMDSKEVLVEGVKVVFMVMANKEHEKMLADMKMDEKIEPGTTHNIMVVLKDGQTQKEITDALVKMKVIDPGGKDQIKTLKAEKEMKSYDAYFDLGQKGRYQVLASFKVGDKTRNAGVYWDVK